MNEKGIEKGDVPYHKRRLESTDFVKLQNEKKWQLLHTRYGIDPGLEPRVRLEIEPFRPEVPQKEEKSKLGKDKDEGKTESEMDTEDLKGKLEEFVYQANLKNRGHYFAKVDNPFTKTKKNKGKNLYIFSLIK